MLLALSFTAAIQEQADAAKTAARTVLPAGIQRYELGRRTRQMERAWIACSDADRRREAIPIVQNAVTGFFSMNLAGVARSLDEAGAVLRGETRSPAQCWADAIVVSVSPRVVSTGPSTIRVHCDIFYAPSVDRPTMNLTLSLGETTLMDRPFTGTFDDDVELPAGQPGDWAMTVRAVAGGEVVREWPIGISRVSDLERRLEQLAADLASPGAERNPIELATARYLADLLSRLARGETLETDVAASRLLAEAESLVRAAASELPARESRTGDFYIAVPIAKVPAAVRVYAPDRDAEVLVVALHGAGGSANMFADAYGDGLIVRLCKDRGWALAAPGYRTPLDDLWAIVTPIQQRIAPSARRLFVVGHSLGAVTALRMGQMKPEGVHAIAAISGGSFGDLAPLARMPVFVAAGTLDFGKAGSTSVAKRLEELGAPVQMRLYDCEHLLVVPDSLPEIFRWLDTLAQEEADSDQQ